MVIDKEDAVQGETWKFFREKPHKTRDKYFSVDLVMDWLGQNGFGATMTCWRGRLPSGAKNQYLHKKKTDTKSQSKAAQFNHPINIIKLVPAVGLLKAYQRIHTSFQSTSLCNISTMNLFNKCVLWLRKK